MVGEEFVSPKSGVLTSPNFPHFYPKHVNSTETIQVREGSVIKLEFRHFRTESSQDYLWITEDGVGQLTYKMHGRDTGSDLVSRTETVHVKFQANTDSYWKSYRSGWRIEWTEVPPVCPSNSTTLFSNCPRGLTTPIRRGHWFGESRNTCEDKFGQLVGIESTEGICLSCLSCEGEAAERKRALKEQMEREWREIEVRALARARNRTLAGE